MLLPRRAWNVAFSLNVSPGLEVVVWVEFSEDSIKILS